MDPEEVVRIQNPEVTNVNPNPVNPEDGDNILLFRILTPEIN